MEELHISQDLLRADLWNAVTLLLTVTLPQKCQHILQDTQWEQPESKLDVRTPQTTPTIKTHVGSSTFFLAQNSLPLPGR